MGDSFYIESIKHKCVFTIRDSLGFPSPINTDGERAQPFWSSEKKAKSAIKNNLKYKKYNITKISINKFLFNWLSGLSKDKIKVGINWKGINMSGYDLYSKEVLDNFNKIINTQCDNKGQS